MFIQLISSPSPGAVLCLSLFLLFIDMSPMQGDLSQEILRRARNNLRCHRGAEETSSGTPSGRRKSHTTEAATVRTLNRRSYSPVCALSQFNPSPALKLATKKCITALYNGCAVHPHTHHTHYKTKHPLSSELLQFSVNRLALLHPSDHHPEAAEVVKVCTLCLRFNLTTPGGRGERLVHIRSVVLCRHLSRLLTARDLWNEDARECETFHAHHLPLDAARRTLHQYAILIKQIDNDHKLVEVRSVVNKCNPSGLDEPGESLPIARTL